ncbi:MAG: cytochrome oxidase subunit III [Chloroflexi bacterium]|nr:MAG: cytochrome oxidase subunit III [SAR202 cluster bacterium]MBF06764.1 cytochrome oxidase subunit III [Chloroflexota bacterium]MCH2321852.1 cytochrome c oxidase subunit 3 [SAR202 cluster bacterium]MQF64003.1 cytochrome oxidase subunit III [SAR202 cluster bacterium AD-802-L14_MRT_200m]
MTQAAITEHHTPVEETSTGLNNRKLLMWAFLGSDVMFFGAFIATYLVYRGKSLVGPYPSEVLNIPITTVSTFVLLMSSLAMVLALHYVKEGEKNKGTLWILAVVVLGAIFMGFQFVEFREFAHLGLTPRTNIFGTTFFILTGIHGAHVTIGVIWMAFLAYSSNNGALRSDNALDLEIAGLYWHFVDIVWIVIFTVIYLISANDAPPPGMETITH